MKFEARSLKRSGFFMIRVVVTMRVRVPCLPRTASMFVAREFEQAWIVCRVGMHVEHAPLDGGAWHFGSSVDFE
jgi:hypothetical protein